MMILQWLRFILTAILLISGLFIILTGIVAQYRFHYALNRMHGASMGDSLGLFLILLALMVGSSTIWMMVRYFLVILTLWFTSPTGGHLIARMELVLNEKPEEEMEIQKR